MSKWQLSSYWQQWRQPQNSPWSIKLFRQDFMLNSKWRLDLQYSPSAITYYLFPWWQCETCTVWKFNHYMWSWCHFYEADLAVLIIDRRQMFGNVRKWTQTFKREIWFGIKWPHLFFFIEKPNLQKDYWSMLCHIVSFSGWLIWPPSNKKNWPQSLQPLQLMMLTYPRLSKANEGQCA